MYSAKKQFDVIFLLSINFKLNYLSINLQLIKPNSIFKRAIQPIKRLDLTLFT
jgi:hypothetical protein